jgi:hypothetical protein
MTAVEVLPFPLNVPLSSQPKALVASDGYDITATTRII